MIDRVPPEPPIYPNMPVGKWEMPYYGAAAGFNPWGIFGQLGSLPRYAKGGIVTHPQIAMVGEQGPEAIVPLGGQQQGGGQDSGEGQSVPASLKAALDALHSAAGSETDPQDKMLIMKAMMLVQQIFEQEQKDKDAALNGTNNPRMMRRNRP